MKKSLITFLFLASVSLTAIQAHAQVVIISNLTVKAGDVSKADLNDVFTGTSANLKDGSHVTPVLLKQGATQEAFLTEYIGKTDSALNASWRSLVFTGQRSMPKSVDSDAAMVEYVAHTAGAIGYVGKSSPHEGVKTLTVK